jgi:pimeloyl-ACP methyl ester carboxylesterase
LLAGALGLAALLTASPALADYDGNSSRYAPGLRCHDIGTSVRLGQTPATNGATPYRIKGQLCWQGRLEDKTLQLLVPGFSYGTEYWDLPYQPEKYSYVRAITGAGYATLNLDRALTPTPPASEVTLTAEGYLLRQIVDQLRAGRIADTRFRKIIGVGHSMGAGVLLVAASGYTGFSGLILSDYLHQSVPAGVANARAQMGAAQLNPQFAQLPEGYISTLPGAKYRMAAFYNPVDVDPRVVETDERTKRAGTVGELTSVNDPRDPKYSLAITVPVLQAVGEKDTLDCDPAVAELSCADHNAVMVRERSSFTSRVDLETYVLPRSGHDINLHRGASCWFRAAIAWADRHVTRH